VKRRKAVELPEWLTETPVMQYTLEAFFDEDKERVELTLEEYEALKIHVGKLRGYNLPKDQALERRHS
jgi:hypothetical protein